MTRGPCAQWIKRSKRFIELTRSNANLCHNSIGTTNKYKISSVSWYGSALWRVLSGLIVRHPPPPPGNVLSRLIPQAYWYTLYLLFAVDPGSISVNNYHIVTVVLEEANLDTGTDPVSAT
jgi:hypothetical protein